MYKKVSTDLNFSAREQDTLKFWNDNKIFEKSIDQRDGCEHFAFYDGPPTANGMPHIGHILTRAYKDLIPRYKTMKGYNVLRKGGWDTHGLPVELEVEKALKISGKPQIEAYGVEDFIKICKESVWKYEKEWREVSERVGFWVDMESPYITYEDNYIESVWWALKQIWEKDLIYKGHKVVPYCPRCGTSLSGHEVAQGYKDLKEDSLIAKFKVKNAEKTYILAWTTTPWTLPSNVGLAVNAKENYAKVQVGDEIYIMAEALVEKVLPEDAKTLEIVKGKDLELTEYEPLFNFAKVESKCFFVVCDDYVQLTDGTGVVHIAPAFGEDDARVAKKYNLPLFMLVNEQGSFIEEVEPWAGVFVKKADPSIIEYLKNQNSVYKVLNITHSYPHCWRCDTPLLYYARNAWFINMSSLRDNLLKINDNVNWMPDNIKTGRFGNFLENVIDWNLSRERYWGTPLPIWECNCGHRHMIGSVNELKEMSVEGYYEGIELHKPYIDKVLIKCDKCNGNMKRVVEVIDCWFDSGSMPFAQFHYPFENKEAFENYFPANYISEAVDQTRGWFYTMMAISTAIFDKPPYQNCIVLGHVLDKDGKKMSKSKGNAVDPKEALETHGADAVRWYFFANSAPWLPSRFYPDAVSEYQRKFMGTFWNTYAFYVLYANIDQFNPTDYKLEFEKLSVMDKWILSKLNSVVKFVDEGLENFKVTESARALDQFVDNLSNWYVRRCRERFWVSEMPQDKINAYLTLHTCLTTLAKISAPFIPFMAEEIYQNLVRGIDKNAPESIHLCDFPTSVENYIDLELEKNMDTVYSIVELGRAARNSASMKNRQPLATMFAKSPNMLDESYQAIITEELNVKSIQFVEDVTKFASYKFKPQLKTLGPKYGKILPKISKYLADAPSSLMEDLKTGTTFMIDDMEVILTKEDVLVEATHSEGYVTETGNNCTVVLDTNLTPELIEEGFVREVVSKIQTMRKEAGFEVTDKIKVYYHGNDKLSETIAKNLEEIKADVLATEITAEKAKSDAYTKEWSINNEDIVLQVEKV